MPDWKLWRDMALESSRAGRAIQDVSDRGAINRFYYAAYQMCTAYLLYRNLQPPQAREAWSHTETPDLFEEALRPLIISRSKRQDLGRRLESLYRLRCFADYVSAFSVPHANIPQAYKDSNYLVRVIDDILPGA